MPKGHRQTARMGKLDVIFTEAFNTAMMEAIDASLAETPIQGGTKLSPDPHFIFQPEAELPGNWIFYCHATVDGERTHLVGCVLLREGMLEKPLEVSGLHLSPVEPFPGGIGT